MSDTLDRLPHKYSHHFVTEMKYNDYTMVFLLLYIDYFEKDKTISDVYYAEVLERFIINWNV